MLPFFARRSGLREGGSLSKYEDRGEGWCYRQFWRDFCGRSRRSRESGWFMTGRKEFFIRMGDV
jgi:hypothetical protein